MKELDISPDVPARLAALPQVALDYDHAALDANGRETLALLIEAARPMDEIYMLQMAEDGLELRDRLARDSSPLGKAAYEYFLQHKSRWDAFDEQRPFIGPFEGRRPPGAGYYPLDLTKTEFERYIEAHPEEYDALTGQFAVVRREGERLAAVPYSQQYRAQLERSAAKLREAAAVTGDPTLRAFLELRAAAYFTDEYRESDMAWMDLAGPIDIVIGPYEVYEDELFNSKAAFAAFITVVDPALSAMLAVYAGMVEEMERNLPISDEHKNFNRGAHSPIRAVDLVFAVGDGRAGIQTSAYNLPNDESVQEAKGSKKVLLRNIMRAKFDVCGAPVALEVLDPSQTGKLSFDAYFTHVLFHELSHGVGPGLVVVNGRKAEIRMFLKELSMTIEECKADVVGMWNLLAAIDRGVVTGFDAEQLMITDAGLHLRSMRLGLEEAHGRSNLIQRRWHLERGGIVASGDGRLHVDPAAYREGVRALAHELLMIQATGDYARAERLLGTYGVPDEEVLAMLARLKEIPVDFRPVYPAAGER